MGKQIGEVEARRGIYCVDKAKFLLADLCIQEVCATF